MLLSFRKAGDTIKNRIKSLRKTLGLTQQEFADGLHIKRGAVANYETGGGISDNVVHLLCTTYNVDEQWLRTGIGEMFRDESEEEELARLVGTLFGCTDDEVMLRRKRQLISALLRMSPEGWDIVIRLAEDMLSG